MRLGGRVARSAAATSGETSACGAFRVGAGCRSERFASAWQGKPDERNAEPPLWGGAPPPALEALPVPSPARVRPAEPGVVGRGGARSLHGGAHGGGEVSAPSCFRPLCPRQPPDQPARVGHRYPLQLVQLACPVARARAWCCVRISSGHALWHVGSCRQAWLACSLVGSHAAIFGAPQFGSKVGRASLGSPLEASTSRVGLQADSSRLRQTQAHVSAVCGGPRVVSQTFATRFAAAFLARRSCSKVAPHSRRRKHDDP